MSLCCGRFVWHSQVSISKLKEFISSSFIILIFLSKGGSRRSRNIGPTRAQSFSRRPWAHRRTWSTRCKGNTEELGTLVLIFYCISTILLLYFLISIAHIVFISLSKGLTGTPGVQGAEGKPGPLVSYSVQSDSQLDIGVIF